MGFAHTRPIIMSLTLSSVFSVLPVEQHSCVRVARVCEDDEQGGGGRI